MRTLAAFLLLCAAAFAQSPSADLDGPLNARQGQLIILTVTQTNADQVAWDVDPDVTVPVSVDPEEIAASRRTLEMANFDVPDEPANAEVLWAISEDGRSVYLASYPGNVRLAVAVRVGEELVVGLHTVTIKTASHVEPPKPEPEPEPTPLEGLALDAFTQASAVERRPGEAVNLAGAFRSVANRAEAKSWTADKLWGGELKGAVSSVIQTSEQRSRWQSFNDWMGEAFPTGIRGDMPEVIRRLNAIADGLEAAEGK